MEPALLMSLSGAAGQEQIEADDWDEAVEYETDEDNEAEAEEAEDEVQEQDDEGGGQEHENEDAVRSAKRTKKGTRNPPKRGVFRCDGCPRVFQHKQSLTRHVAGHLAPSGNYGCTMCDRTFSHKQSKVRVPITFTPLV